MAVVVVVYLFFFFVSFFSSLNFLSSSLDCVVVVYAFVLVPFIWQMATLQSNNNKQHRNYSWSHEQSHYVFSLFFFFVFVCHILFPCNNVFVIKLLPMHSTILYDKCIFLFNFLYELQLWISLYYVGVSVCGVFFFIEKNGIIKHVSIFWKRIINNNAHIFLKY